MSLIKHRARQRMVSAARSVCDNVYGEVMVPDVQAEKNAEFPYVCMIESKEYIKDQRVLSKFSVLGFVKGDDENLVEKRDTLENKIFWALQNLRGINIRIEKINNRNIYQPWGLEAGVFFPYAAFRMEIKLPNIRREGVEEELMDWQALDARFLKKAGDNMAGALGIGSDGKWTISRDGDNLIFSYDGSPKIRFNPTTSRIEAIFDIDTGRGSL